MTSRGTTGLLSTQTTTSVWSQTSVKPDTPPPLAPEDTAMVVMPTPEPPIPGSFSLRNPIRNSFHTFEGLLEAIAGLSTDDQQQQQQHQHHQHHHGPAAASAAMRTKAFSFLSESSLSIAQNDADEERSSSGSASTSSSSSSSSSLSQQQTTPMTKRQHALQELLTSERAYASDLALICEVHIPLALGHPTTVHTPPITPPHSSASSSRTMSIASDPSTLGPPMSIDDTRIIFNNVAELAMFSESFCEKLERAIGAAENEDCIGKLFLGMVSDFETPYKYYITRHPSALAHLQGLPQSPALSKYLSHTQSVASAVSHAWDLASLLIKPVQRLLKYPLLLAAIIEETPDSHPDKENLELARKKMEEVARNVNEGRRRAEVVKEVLSAKKKPLSSSVNLTKMKSLRVGSSKNAQLADIDNEEAARVEKMHFELKQIEAFAKRFAKDALDWSRSMRYFVIGLRSWAASFGKVIGLSTEQGSEAFDAFMAVVEEQLIPLCINLEATVNEKLLKEIAHLLTTMTQPFKLLESMNEQEPLHTHLITMNMSKGRPPAHLLEASNNYRALRGQLAAELPEYLMLMHKGIAILIRRLVEIQTEFWRSVRVRWVDLWEMLRVEGELNAGHTETIAVWKMRWSDVDDVVANLNIMQQRSKRPHSETKSSRNSTHSHHGDSPTHSKRAQLVNLLASLEPVHVNAIAGLSTTPHTPHPLTPPRTRPRGTSDVSTHLPKYRHPGRRASNESLRSEKPKNIRAPRRKTDEFAEYKVAGSAVAAATATIPPEIPPTFPPMPRTKSMPLPKHASGRSTSGSRTAVTTFAGEDVATSSYYPFHNGSSQEERRYERQEHVDSREYKEQKEQKRGRSPRKTSLKRKQTQTPTGTSGSGGGNGTGTSRDSPKRSSASALTDSFKTIAALFNSGSSAQPTMSSSSFDSDETWLLPAAPYQGQDPQPLTRSQRDSWMNKDAKYVCRVIHACKPPAAVSYFSFPFFKLVENEFYEVLQEAGHPSIHPKLPLYVDEGEDCLLLCRDDKGDVGWALASFLEPIDVLSFEYGG
ncbi:hypothetical protein AMATHDRAFT_57560 [Amanita thiersii Skay4041]|uniref:DH domain-containing protein n=1 Tax=Amanita thiersii Skay4041 TaxID=703135 RepID=A0A2A9NV92_9AGAR|nr:hypothetical protein AMATHDRAFT_57560 [Amanita thiersii Skay4041]